MEFLVGDLQGCAEPLDRLLAEIDFSPSRDHLVVLGDLVNRGPQSARVLERLQGLGGAVTCLLGNHDLHLLAVAFGVRPPHRGDTLDEILASPQRDAWLDWLRQQKLAHRAGDWLCVHAGVVPQWDAAMTMALAAEAEAVIRGDDFDGFVRVMYGNRPPRWDDMLQGADRIRCIVNVLTRIRFCRADGTLEFDTKSSAATPPDGFLPWFEQPHRRTAGTPVAFGHWSTLGLVDRTDLLSLDTGCVWGGCLSAARIDGGRRELVQINCPQVQRPGA